MAPYLCDLAMLDRGYLRVARPWGVEVRIHWSVLVAALLVARLRLEPVIWLGFLGIVLTHQLGHAAAVASVGGTLLGLDTTGLGGNGRWRGAGTLLERAWVAWGGVLAQAVLLAAALSLVSFSGVRGSSQLEYCFIEVNLGLMAINLLPFAPMDGALAWRLFGELSASEWTSRQTSLGWLGRWARWRRARRQDGPGGADVKESAAPPSSGAASSSGLAVPVPGAPTEPGTDPPASASPYARSRRAASPRSGRYGQAATDDAQHVDEEPLASPRPSEQAQREIDALLRRVADRVARSRRGR